MGSRPSTPPIGLRLARTARIVSQAFERAMAEAGGSASTWQVLLLVRSGNWETQSELAEELGITGVELVPRFRRWYHDEHTHYLAFGYEVTWDGPVVHQPEEVADGGWMPWQELLERLADPTWPFVPDGRAGIAAYLDALAGQQ